MESNDLRDLLSVCPDRRLRNSAIRLPNVFLSNDYRRSKYSYVPSFDLLVLMVSAVPGNG